MAILQNVWQKLRSRGGSDRAALRVAAFGKHPGWDDHIPDLGLDTESLVQLKRELYVDGIGGNIDSGAWEVLERRQLLADFRHAFVRARGGAWVMGRVWSSTDGKGRSRYPMVLCVECRGLPYHAMAPIVHEHLEATAERCQATRDGDAVTSIVANLREELRAVDFAAARRAEVAPLPALSILAARPEMGEEREGLMRLLYRAEREVSEYHRPRPGRRAPKRAGRDPVSDADAPRGHHIRVPRCADGTIEALSLWIAFLDEILIPTAPRWVIVPVDEPWADLLVGPVTASEFSHLRVTTAKEPLVTDIPYRLDDDFAERAGRLISEAVESSSAEAGGDESAGEDARG